MRPALITTLPELRLKYSHEVNVQVYRSAYMADRAITAMVLTTEYGEQIATVSVNLAAYNEYPVDSDHIFVKNYGENEGIMEALIEAGVLSKAIREVPCGYETAYECRILI